jgi:hypothetical protein
MTSCKSADFGFVTTDVDAFFGLPKATQINTDGFDSVERVLQEV